MDAAGMVDGVAEVGAVGGVGGGMGAAGAGGGGGGTGVSWANTLPAKSSAPAVKVQSRDLLVFMRYLHAGNNG
jgi:hypothetical protein